MTTEEFEEIKAEISQRKAKTEQKRGQMKQILKDLGEEFGCKTMEEAVDLLAAKKNKLKALEERTVKKEEELRNLLGKEDDN